MSALIGHIAAFLSNLFFGLSIPVTKELLSSWLDPIGYTLLRALSAAVIFWTASFFLPREKVAGRDLAIIAAGAFHVSKVEDLIPELQGRFPITVELQSLSKEDFKNILTQPQNAITTQYAKLLKVENIDLVFTDDAIDAVAQISADVNSTSEDIGARRLHTVMEHLLEDISFNAGGDYPEFTVTIDKKYVEEHLETMIRNRDLKKYVL